MPQMTRATTEQAAEPAWEIARIFPNQGVWDELDYLRIETNHLIEFSDGFVEVLPIPTTSHQLIVQYLSNLLLAFATAGRLGTVLFAPLRVRLRKAKYREPDVVFMLAAHSARIKEEYWDGADLVMEVVSEESEDRDRDVVTKRAEYAKAGIPEYWIVDPYERRIHVLKLKGKRYVVHGEYSAGQQAMSALLNGFEVEVSAVLERGAANGKARMIALG